MDASVKHPTCRVLIRTALVSFFTFFCALTNACDLDLSNTYGPFDFYDPHSSKAASGGQSPIYLVEKYHFSDDMKRMTRGVTGVAIGPDLDYVLRAFPNHPQALDLASRLEYALKTKRADPSLGRMVRDTDCYFERSLRFRPTEGNTFYLLGIHQHRNNRFEKARNAYETAAQRGIQHPEFLYNFGLTLYELGEYDKARALADKAASAGYPFPALNDKLKTKGK